MFRNYFKTAWRNLLKNKFFTVINISGLALGMASSILILLWVQDERSYDQFHDNKNLLYRVMGRFHENDKQTFTFEGTSALLADGLKKEIPEVNDAVSITQEKEILFSYTEKSNKERGVYATDNLFNIFSFPIIKGNKKNILIRPDDIVISQKLSQKYFGTNDPIGKTIRIENKKEYKISGVFADIPHNSSLQFEFVLPFKSFIDQNPWLNSWASFSPRCFVLLNKGDAEKKLNDKLKKFIQAKSKQSELELFLQPITQMYLYADFKNGIQNGGRIEYVRLFSAIAIFILLVACVNFMNLATAKSFNRAKEIGIRKVVGSGKLLLTGQFIGEAILVAILAIIASAVLIQLLLPYFNDITQKQITLNWNEPKLIFSLLGFAVITGIISGVYPAFFLSSLKPIKALGKLKFSSRAILMRKSLVAFQFILCVLFIVSTLVIHLQMQYIQEKNLGFDRENIISLNLEGNLAKNFEAFKIELLKFSSVQLVTVTTQSPINIVGGTDAVSWAGKDPGTKTPFYEIAADYDFIRTMKMQLKTGRDFSPAFAADSLNVIVNEQAVKTMHLQNPIGANVTVGDRKGKIVGVVKDFNHQSLHAGIQPLIIDLTTNPGSGEIFIRYQPGMVKVALANIGTTCKKFDPEYPFNYNFLDESFNQQYHTESIIESLSGYFTFFAIFISSLGLLGLSIFSTEQRCKEIGIRKVLGANATNIAMLFSKDFLKPILLSSVIASPLGWWLMYNWLQNYAYRINISWWVFAVAAILALSIAVITVSFQAIKAALANPVKSLRTE